VDSTEQLNRGTTLLNKSFMTNILALMVMLLSLFIPVFQKQFLYVGLFALSGAITNWLAIYMLFEKIPFLYGSGVIPNRFEDFKIGIRDLIMGEFFNQKLLDQFFSTNTDGNKLTKINLNPVVDAIDHNKIFDAMILTIMDTPFGGMINMFGGSSSLDQLRPKFVDKFKEVIKEITQSDSFQQAMTTQLSAQFSTEGMKQKIESLVTKRLNELTPHMVKEIIQKNDTPASRLVGRLGWRFWWSDRVGE